MTIWNVRLWHRDNSETELTIEAGSRIEAIRIARAAHPQSSVISASASTDFVLPAASDGITR